MNIIVVMTTIIITTHHYHHHNHHYKWLKIDQVKISSTWRSHYNVWGAHVILISVPLKQTQHNCSK